MPNEPQQLPDFDQLWDYSQPEQTEARFRDILPQAQVLAGMITSKGRLAIQSALRAIRTGLDSPLAEGLARETELFGSLCETPDKKEGTAAFLEKRPPKFLDH